VKELIHNFLLHYLFSARN